MNDYFKLAHSSLDSTTNFESVQNQKNSCVNTYFSTFKIAYLLRQVRNLPASCLVCCMEISVIKFLVQEIKVGKIPKNILILE